MKNHYQAIKDCLEEDMSKTKSLRRSLDYIAFLFHMEGIEEAFNWQIVEVKNNKSQITIKFPDNEPIIIKTQKTLLNRIYDRLSELGINTDGFDHFNDFIPSIEIFLEGFEFPDSDYYWNGNGIGFFLNDYINENTLKSKDICWSLEEK